MKTKSKHQIRWMTRKDIPEVLGIDQSGFVQRWTEDDYICCLRVRNRIGMVLEIGDKVVGFMIYELHKNKLHVVRMAVSQYFRREGIGSLMVRKLLSKLSKERRSRVSIYVRETNLAAQLFFSCHGFMAVSVERQWFKDTGEDAYLMRHQYHPENDPEKYPTSLVVNRALTE